MSEISPLAPQVTPPMLDVSSNEVTADRELSVEDTKVSAVADGDRSTWYQLELLLKDSRVVGRSKSSTPGATRYSTANALFALPPEADFAVWFAKFSSEEEAAIKLTSGAPRPSYLLAELDDEPDSQ